MKKVDIAAFLLVAFVAYMLWPDNSPEPKGEGILMKIKNEDHKGNSTEKIKDNSQSVLTNLEGQLDKFADELAADIEGVDNLNPEVAGFENGVPEAYAPKSTAAFGSKQKLIDDLEFRLKKFGNDALESEQEFAKSHDVSGVDRQSYRDLVNKHKAQKKQIMARHNEIVQQYGAEAPAEPKLR